MELKDAQVLVVKVGTSTLTYENGKVNLRRLERLCRTLSDLQNAGRKLVLVSSGAIGVGMGKLGLPQRPRGDGEKAGAGRHWPVRADVPLRQVLWRVRPHCGPGAAHRRRGGLPARGRENVQQHLPGAARHGRHPGGERERHRGDRERAGRARTSATTTPSPQWWRGCAAPRGCIILTDIDGLYDSDPRKNPQARRIPRVEEITPAVEELAGGAGSNRGTGGMATKLKAAKLAKSQGIRYGGDFRQPHGNPLPAAAGRGRGDRVPRVKSGAKDGVKLLQKASAWLDASPKKPSGRGAHAAAGIPESRQWGRGETRGHRSKSFRCRLAHRKSLRALAACYHTLTKEAVP